MFAWFIATHLSAGVTGSLRKAISFRARQRDPNAFCLNFDLASAVFLNCFLCNSTSLLMVETVYAAQLGGFMPLTSKTGCNGSDVIFLWRMVYVSSHSEMVVVAVYELWLLINILSLFICDPGQLHTLGLSL